MLKQEDLRAIAGHECRHATQLIDMREGKGKWGALDKRYTTGTPPDLVHFVEADAYVTNLNSQGSWKYIETRFGYFRDTNYNPAEQLYSTESNASAKKAMKEILQSVYQDIPFKEMKYRSTLPGFEYDWKTRAPR